MLRIIFLAISISVVMATTAEAMDTVSVYDVQYTTEAGSSPESCYESSLLGDSVIVAGIVTAVNPLTFSLEERPGGPWRGLVIRQSPERPTVGDSVVVRGEVQEFHGLTRIKEPSSVHIFSDSVWWEPHPVSTKSVAGGCDSSASGREREALEGVMVKIRDVVVTRLPDSYDQWWIADSSGVACQVDNRWFSFDPDSVGQRIESIVGIVGYDGDAGEYEYDVNPRSPEDIVSPEDSSEITICDVQSFSGPGTGDDCYPSLYNGQAVTLTGIVTAVRSGQYPNFFLQQAHKACGVFFYQDVLSPQVGDSLTATADVDEYFGMTEMKNVSGWTIHASGLAVPDPVVISTRTLAGGCSARAEVYEGVLVQVNHVVVTQGADQHGQWYVADTSGASCQIEDYFFHYEPSVGDTCPYVIGVVMYGFDEYEICPRDADDVGCDVETQSCRPIAEIQYGTDPGSGDDCYPSPFFGQAVTVCGVVTGVTTNTAYDNFWLQDAESRWSGIYVFDNTIHPDRGDSLKVTGVIDEYYGLTELKGISWWERRGEELSEPEALVITCADLAGGCSDTTHESYEGVLVQVNDVVVTRETDQYGQWYVTDGTDTCEIDDLCFHYDAQVGEVFGSIVGVVNYSFGEYEINPRGLNSVDPWGEGPELPSSCSLSQNYPNPFNPWTEMEYALPRGAWVKLEVYNVSGQKVATLVDGPREAGIHRVRWEASVTSGVYLCRLAVGDFTAVTKMVFLK